MPYLTTHLRNQLTATISAGINRAAWAHEITDDVERVLEAHEDCAHCNEGCGA